MPEACAHTLYSPVVMGGQHRGQRHPLAAGNLQQLERMEVECPGPPIPYWDTSFRA